MAESESDIGITTDTPYEVSIVRIWEKIGRVITARIALTYWPQVQQLVLEKNTQRPSKFEEGFLQNGWSDILITNTISNQDFHHYDVLQMAICVIK